MTPDEVSALIEQIPQGIHVDEFIVMLATKAAEYEREECAKVCERRSQNHMYQPAYRDKEVEARHCAEDIRERGQA